MKKRLLLGLAFIFTSALVVQAQDVDVPGNLTMVDSTDTTGNILKGGGLFIHNFGPNNTFIGSNAGNLTMTGPFNTASGVAALRDNTTGSGNTASGASALLLNTSGNNNTASGVNALFNNTTGSNNIAVGVNAAGDLTVGSNNIHIGAPALAPDESNTIRIGTGGVHTRFFAAGVGTATVTGVPVLIAADGQLGVAPSSRRFKEDIRNMGQASSGLRRLRPVTFYYKQAQQGGPRQVQYGLIAEEVAAVYPELVEYSDTGEPFTVRYHLLSTMLLNEVQRQDRQIEEQRQQIHAQGAQIAELQAQLAAIAGRLKRLDRQELVAATASSPTPTP